MIESILSLERRLVASPDIWELKMLYKFFTEKSADGQGVNDEFIADSTKNYNHKRHYVAFLERKADEFYIPATLLGLVISDVQHVEPRFWGYDRNVPEIDTGKIKGERWKAILKVWAQLGILIVRSGNSGYTKTVTFTTIIASSTRTLVEWQKECIFTINFSSHPYFKLVYAEIPQYSLIELKANFPRVPVIHPLSLSIIHILTCVLIL